MPTRKKTTKAAPTEPEAEHPFLGGDLYPAWSRMTPEVYGDDLRAAYDLYCRCAADLRDLPPGRETYENVFDVIDAMQIAAQVPDTLRDFLVDATGDHDLRNPPDSGVPERSHGMDQQEMDAVLRRVVKRAASRPWVADLSPAKRRFVQQCVEKYCGGEKMTEEDRKAAETLRSEIRKLEEDYFYNVDYSTSIAGIIIEDPAEVDGLPKSWIKANVKEFPNEPDGPPEWHVSAEDFGLYSLMVYCDVESTRKKCWEELNSIGGITHFESCGDVDFNDNEGIVHDILRKRLEFAKLSGYANYADKVNRGLSAGGAEQALAFVDELIHLLRPAFEQECKELFEFVSDRVGHPVEALNPWDVDYYISEFKRERDDQPCPYVAPYLRSDYVIKGVCDCFSRLFGVDITELPSVCRKPGGRRTRKRVEVWHRDVKVFQVTDTKTGVHLGSFYLDLHQRPHKSTGMWTKKLRVGEPAKNGKPHTPHLAVVFGDFPKLTRKGYILLRHSQVQSLFHEFGHLFHIMLSDTEVRTHTACNVALDFMEFPSSLTESLAWEPEVLSTFAFHHKTGEPMPAELMEELIESRQAAPIFSLLNGLHTAKLDLEMHLHYEEKFAGKSIDTVSHEMGAGCIIPQTMQSASILRHLPHCFNYGYQACYYTYTWCKILVADAFSRFREEGVLNPATGAALRECILKHGDDYPAAELIRNFTGHAPDVQIFLNKLRQVVQEE